MQTTHGMALVAVLLLGGVLVVGADPASAAGGNSTIDKPADGETVTVVVRFTPYEPGPVSTQAEPGPETLKDHATTTKEPFKQRFDADGLGALADPAVEINREFWIANAALVEVDTSRVSLEELLAVEHVERIHENFAVTTADGAVGASTIQPQTVDATATNTTYGVDMVRAPDVWDVYNTRGGGVTVAVLDTGVDPDHPDIEIANDNFEEFTTTGQMTGADPYDPNGHGTHVSGTATGGNNSGAYIGVAPNATLAHGKVLNEDGGGTFTQIVAGMEWAVEDRDADVVSLSLGAEGYYEAFIEPVRNARSEGTLVVAAVGNDGVGTSSSPGNVYDAIAVGAVDADRDVPGFSSGDEIDTDTAWGTTVPAAWPDSYLVPNVTAPGVSVTSAVPGGGYDSFDGTSMATPHVSGAAALVIAAQGGAVDDDRVEAALIETATDPVDDQPDRRYGYGIVDALGAANDVIDANATIAGTITNESDTQLNNITVSAIRNGSVVRQTTTGPDGTYSLSVSDGNWTVSATGFGYNDSTSGTLDLLSGETESQNFTLSETLAVETSTDAPRRQAPDGNYTMTFRVANAANYTPTLTPDSETIDGGSVTDSLTLSVEGTPRNVSDSIPLADAGEQINVTIEPNTSIAPSTVTLTHRFNSTIAGEAPLNRTTRTTKIHADPLATDTRDPQTVLNFAVPDTTVELTANTTVPATDSGPALRVNRSVTLSGAANRTLTIDNQTTGDNATGVVVTNVGASIRNLQIDGGGVRTALRVDDDSTGGSATLSNLTVTNATTGTAIETAGMLANSTYTGVTYGINISGRLGDAQNNTITASDTAVTVNGSVGSFDTTPDLRATTIRDTPVGMRYLPGAGATETLDTTITNTTTGIDVAAGTELRLTNATVTDARTRAIRVGTAADNVTIERPTTNQTPTGIAIVGAQATTVTNASVNATDRAVVLDANATATVDVALTERLPVEFAAVHPDDVTTTITLDTGRQIEAAGRNVTVVRNATDGPTAGDSLRPLSEGLNLTNTSSDGTLELGVSYDRQELLTEGIFADALGLYRANESAPGNWTRVNTTGVNLTAQTVTATLDSFSTFRALATDSGGQLNGTITDADGTPLADITITASNDSAGTYTTTTNATGAFVRSLPANETTGTTYTVTAENDTYQPASTAATITVGNTTTQDFSLEQRDGTVTGTVTDAETGDPISGATISAGDSQTSTTSNGGYTLSLAPGEYSLLVAADGYQDSSVSITVEPNATTTQNVALSPESTDDGDTGDDDTSGGGGGGGGSAPAEPDPFTPAVSITGPTTVEADGVVRMTIEAANIGDEPGTATLTVAVDNETRINESITLTPGNETTQTVFIRGDTDRVGDTVSLVATYGNATATAGVEILAGDAPTEEDDDEPSTNDTDGETGDDGPADTNNTENETAEPPSQPDGIPGFGAGVALVALVAGGAVLARRR